MNWHLSRLGMAVLFCVAVFCFVLDVSLLVLVFATFFGGDFVTAYWTVHRSFTCFTLEATQSADGHVYALISNET